MEKATTVKVKYYFKDSTTHAIDKDWGESEALVCLDHNLPENMEDWTDEHHAFDEKVVYYFDSKAELKEAMKLENNTDILITEIIK